MQGIKEGTDIQFKAATRDGQEVIIGLSRPAAAGPGPGGDQPRVDTSKLKPLTELGTGKYHGFAGGLYPDGKNERPAGPRGGGPGAGQGDPAARRRRQAEPDRQDRAPVGRHEQHVAGVGRVPAGCSPADDEQEPAPGVRQRCPGRHDGAAIQDPDDGGPARYWGTVDERLKAAGVTRAQVQAVWIKQADAGPSEGFPKYAKKLQANWRRSSSCCRSGSPTASSSTCRAGPTAATRRLRSTRSRTPTNPVSR